MQILITAAMLKSIAPTLTPERAQILADLHNEVCPKYGIDTPARLQAFIAQEAHESQEFGHKAENLNYGAPGLLSTFPKYFNATTAAQYARNPEKIANRVYANRMGNGGEASGDGWKNRGGGFIGMTGDDMYTRYGVFVGITDGSIAEKVRTDDKYAIDSACWIFANEKKLLDEADARNYKLITERINGGLIGYDQRLAYYTKAQRVIV